jgi:hypothetical protein
LNAISPAPNLHAALLWTRKTRRKDGAASVVVIDAGFV